MLDVLIDALLDPADRYRCGLHPIDRRRILLDLLPDARHLIRRIEAGGQFDRRTSSNGYLGVPAEPVGFAGLS
jgi:hypothetical protein